MEYIIGHIDMDAFFASVEERDRPYLKGLPVIIGSDPQGGIGRGVVSTANYEARKLGIGSALPISTAWKLCEEARQKGTKRCVFITPGLKKYKEASKEVFDIVGKFVPVLSQSSVDEASLELSFCKTYEKAKDLAIHIKKEVKKKTGLTCSIGIGPNKMIAKIASDYQKPNGLTVVCEESVNSFLRPLAIRCIPGVGKVSEGKLLKRGIKTIKDAQDFSWQDLQNMFGKIGFSLWEKVHGIDERTVDVTKAKNKSIGKHHTFLKDIYDMKEVIEVIQEQVKTIIHEVSKHKFTNFRTVVLTIRFSNFVTNTRSLTLDEPIDSGTQLELKALKLLIPFFEKTENPKNLGIRLVGVRVEKLS